MGGQSSSPWPGEAQQYSSAPAASGYAIQQPRPAPYQQGQLGGNTSYGGDYAHTAQYSGSLTGETQPLSGGYSGSAHQQTTEEHKRARESSSSSGDQQREHGRSHHRHKKADRGSGEHHHGRPHGSQRAESQGRGRRHHEARHQPENQGAHFTPPAPQYQPNPQQNTSWPTNSPATAGYGGGGAPRSYGDDVYIKRQPNPRAGFFPPPPREQFPPMGMEPPQLAPLHWLPPQRPRRVQFPQMSLDPQQPAPVQPPAPTTEMGAEPAASRSNNSLDRFNVVWRDQIFDASPKERGTRGMGPTHFREARIILASFATWDEVTALGQRLPCGRTPVTIAASVKRDDGSRCGLRQWREWTRREDLIVWDHRIRPPTEDSEHVAAQDIEHVAAQIHGYFPERMLGEVVGRLKLFTRMDKHPDAAGRTIGSFPTLGFTEMRARQNQ